MIVLRELAPAKVNLYLQVTARRADGYHLLDSLVGFTDAGDKLEAVAADDVTLQLEGPFAHQLSASDNSVLRAADALRRHAGHNKGAALTLHKHLPIAAGLGGGSADAAAALRLLARLWNLRLSEQELAALALSLGADVPACLRSASLYMGGIGEHIEKGPDLKGLALVLANPGKPLKTPDVFAKLKAPFSSAPRHPDAFASLSACAGFLGRCANDLEAPAIAIMPEIENVLAVLAMQQGCLLARMSGSGATCFGLFADTVSATNAALALGSQQAQWWVKEATLL